MALRNKSTKIALIAYLRTSRGPTKTNESQWVLCKNIWDANETGWSNGIFYDSRNKSFSFLENFCDFELYCPSNYFGTLE